MKDYFICCPFHEGDRTPSLSIVLQDKNNLRAGFAHCFACGWTGNFLQVEKKLGRQLDLSPSIRARLLESVQSVSHTRIGVKAAVSTEKSAKPLKKSELPFRFSQYLKNRGIGEVVQRFNKVYDNGRLNMPFFDEYGNFMGSVERSTGEDKFYKVNGSIRYPIGIEEIKSSDFVFVTEGQIDKMTLEELGFKAVALGTVSNYRLIKYLKNFNICLAFDNDEAGNKATEYAFQFIIRYRRPNLYRLTLPEGFKDMNEFLVSSKNAETVKDWVKSHTRRI